MIYDLRQPGGGPDTGAEHRPEGSPELRRPRRGAAQIFSVVRLMN